MSSFDCVRPGKQVVSERLQSRSKLQTRGGRVSKANPKDKEKIRRQTPHHVSMYVAHV